MSRSLAAPAAAVGPLAGQVPRDVRRHLRYDPFRDYCLFNVDAEHWMPRYRADDLARRLGASLAA